MKIVCMLLFTLSTIFTGTTDKKITLNQDTKTVLASYLEAKNNDYFFETGDKKITFHKVDENAKKTIDFKDAKLKGEFFLIQYTEENAKNEEGDSYIYRTITSIEIAAGN